MIISIFRTIKDHRVTGRCLYPLSDLLTIALLTYLCGGEDYVDMSDFAESMVDNEIEGRWPGLKTFVKVTSKVSKGDTTEESARYYISSDDYPKAKYYYLLARGHWGIENQLHWHLDVTFHEDASRARMDYAPQNLSLIRKMALQIIKNHPDKKRSLRKKNLPCGNGLRLLDRNYQKCTILMRLP